MKVIGLKSFDKTATTTGSQLQATLGAARLVQNAAIQADSGNNAVVFIGGADSQTFPIPPGAAINLEDLFIGSHRCEYDLGSIFVKAASGSQTVHVVHCNEVDAS